MSAVLPAWLQILKCLCPNILWKTWSIYFNIPYIIVLRHVSQQHTVARSPPSHTENCTPSNWWSCALDDEVIYVKYYCRLWGTHPPLNSKTFLELNLFHIRSFCLLIPISILTRTVLTKLRWASLWPLKRYTKVTARIFIQNWPEHLSNGVSRMLLPLHGLRSQAWNDYYYYYYFLLCFYILSLNICHWLQWWEIDKSGKIFSLIHYVYLYLSCFFMKKMFNIEKKISKYCGFYFEHNSFIM